LVSNVNTNNSRGKLNLQLESWASNASGSWSGSTKLLATVKQAVADAEVEISQEKDA
jgi:hypothetical protein